MSIVVFSGSGITLLLHLLSFLFFVMSQRSLGSGQTYIYHACPPGANNTASRQFIYNLSRLFNRKLYDEGGKSLYYKSTDGQDPDKVYGIYLCRFDVARESCQDCIANAIDSIMERCNGTKEAIVWYDECLVRYSNRSFFSTLDNEPSVTLFNVNNITQPDKFMKILKQTFDDVIAMATANASKYATRIVNDTNGFQQLYSLAQCIPDLSAQDCHFCLNYAVERLAGYNLFTKSGARTLLPSCNIRFEIYPFYGDPTVSGAPVPVSQPNTSSRDGDEGSSRKKERRAWIPIVATATAVIVIMLLCSSLWYVRRRNKRDEEEKPNSQEVQLLRLGENRIGNDCSSDILQGEKQIESEEFPLFSLALALQATQHFSDEKKLGEGGFGPVYKGILEDGKEIAVKRLSKTSGQGLREFRNEVTLIAKLQHKNLVRLLGCCLEGNELLLIYEFMPNKSLDFLLFDSTRSKQLEWKTRINIINGIARGLLYLHEDSRLKIIHRDLKASNVLLDHEMNPKISDFGLARIFGGNQSEANTNRIVGTYGYMAPEYAMEGLFSIKSDVFSFGVLLLEIISGRKNTGFYLSEHGLSLLHYTWKLWHEGQALEVMDPILVQSCVPIELMKCIHIGLLCVQEDPTDRPTMSSVVVMLASDNVKLPQPTQPAFSVGRVVSRAAQPSADVIVCSVNEVTLSNISAR